MTAAKRMPRKPVPPAALTVPRVRTVRADDQAEAADTPPSPTVARPRRHRKPRFVF